MDVNYVSHIEMLDLVSISWKTHKYGIKPVKGVPRLLPRYEKQGLLTRCVAAEDIAWSSINPFDFYRPSENGKRDAEAGPHLTFLRLKALATDKPQLLEKGIILFAEKYGLLGLFQGEFLLEPVVKQGKFLIAPEAVVQDGKLHLIDPATQGMELLMVLKRNGFFEDEFLNSVSEDMLPKLVALPKEVRFISPRRPQQSRKVVPWAEIRRRYGAMFVLLPSGKVSVLCTYEPLRSWKALLKAFPEPEDLAHRKLTQLTGVNPIYAPDSDGYLQPGWACDSLWSAMHLMLCLDLSGQNVVQQCASRGCQTYFRVGPYSSTKYCSSRCASRASTRLSRGREP